MQIYTAKHKITALLISIALLVISVICCSWLWVDGFYNLIKACQLRISDFLEMTTSIITMQYLWFILGMVFLQEMTMIFGRYVLGKQGKKERLYIRWHGKDFGLHHLHWGIMITIIGITGQLTATNTNLLLIAVGISCILSDLVHHKVLEILHGDHEGDGQLRRPFKK